MYLRCHCCYARVGLTPWPTVVGSLAFCARCDDALQIGRTIIPLHDGGIVEHSTLDKVLVELRDRAAELVKGNDSARIPQTVKRLVEQHAKALTDGADELEGLRATLTGDAKAAAGK